MDINMNTEIRHLRPSDRRCLIEILDCADHWRQLASILPKPDSQGGYLFTSKMIQLLENHKNQINGSPTRALLDYWGTYGRKRPTIKDLLDQLVGCKLYQAADYVSVKLLNGEPVIRDDGDKIDTPNVTSNNPRVSGFISKQSGPMIHEINNANCNDIEDDSDNFDHKNNAKVSINKAQLSTNLEQKTSLYVPQLNEPVAQRSDVTSLVSLDDNLLNSQVKSLLERDLRFKRYSYKELALSTNNFNPLPLSEGGFKLGEGACGSVYLAHDSRFTGKEIAVKNIRDEYGKHFIRELDVLTRFNHENILNLVGIACEGINLCLVYEYMINGSLGDRLICLNKSEPIDWLTRKQIAIGTARGLGHLHSNSFIHRDIKSANILLDHNWNPKIGDFGLSRLNLPNNTNSDNNLLLFSSSSVTSSSQSTSTSAVNFTSTIIGTSIYMAPESFRGQLTTKMDIYSFGIVLLELLTGLAPFDENREGGDILSWSQLVIDIDDNDQLNNDLLKPILDIKAGQWDMNAALEMMKLSRLSTDYDKKNRPDIDTILNHLIKL